MPCGFQIAQNPAGMGLDWIVKISLLREKWKNGEIRGYRWLAEFYTVGFFVYLDNGDIEKIQ